MCMACIKSEVDITEGITKHGIFNYCKLCDRYNRPPWIRCELESSEMMALCLSKIKGLNKVKLVDTSFIWTEPHSKIIKLKMTVQKEVDKGLLETNFIIDFKVDWVQCDDCKKTFTPHKWSAVCQVRQKVNHKRTFMLLEQIILKNKAHLKILNMKELPEGVDFYFNDKAHAATLADFIQISLPVKIKQSKQLISTDDRSNTANYKYSFMIEVAPVCADDLIIMDKETCKQLGGLGPILLCFKVASKIHLIDPITMKTYEFDENTYWRYNFKSYIDRKCLHEFMIMNVEEEIDYKKFSNPEASLESLESNSKQSILSKSTNYKNILNNTVQLPRIHFKIVTVNLYLI